MIFGLKLFLSVNFFTNFEKALKKVKIYFLNTYELPHSLFMTVLDADKNFKDQLERHLYVVINNGLNNLYSLLNSWPWD